VMASGRGDARHKAGHDVRRLQKAERCNRNLFPGQPCGG
jgi:hypothetical protein